MNYTFSREFANHLQQCNIGIWPEREGHSLYRSLKEDFYALKRALLYTFAKRDGYDLQQFWKFTEVWKDVPEGVMRHTVVHDKPEYVKKKPPKDYIGAMWTSTHEHILERRVLTIKEMTEGSMEELLIFPVIAVHHLPTEHYRYSNWKGTKTTAGDFDTMLPTVRGRILGRMDPDPIDPVIAPNESLLFILNWMIDTGKDLAPEMWHTYGLSKVRTRIESDLKVNQ